MIDAARIVDQLVSADGLLYITSADLRGYVEYSASINPNGDLNPGNVNASTIKFSVAQLMNSLAAYTGRELLYYKGFAAEPVRERSPYQASVVVKNGDWYAAATGRQITVSTGQSYALEQPVGSLSLHGNTLTLLFVEEPYAVAYTVTEEGLTSPIVPVLNQYEKNQALAFARRHCGYLRSTEAITEYLIDMFAGQRYLETTTYEMQLRGHFFANRPKRSTGGLYDIDAVDRMSLFDADMINEVKDVAGSTGATAGKLLAAVCAAAGTPLKSEVRLNETQPVVTPPVESASGKQILTWLGEIMGCSWGVSAEGELYSVWPSQSLTALGLNQYYSMSVDEYQVKPIDKIIVAASTGEAVGESGLGANTLLITGNGLLPYTTEAELASFAATLLPQMQSVPEYAPGSVSAVCGTEYVPGQIISVLDDDGEPVSICISQYTETGFAATLDSYGSATRDTLSYGSLSSQMLKKSLDEVKKQVGGFPEQWNTAIKDTVDLITGGIGGARVDLFDPKSGKPSGTAYLYDSADIKTAKKLLVMNAGGIAFYANGFDPAHPEASNPQYVIMNSKGQVNASTILTGSLVANLIKTGTITSLDGNMKIDVDEGLITFKGEYGDLNLSRSAYELSENVAGSRVVRVLIERVNEYYGGKIQFLGDSYYSYMTSDGLAIRKCTTPHTVGTDDKVVFDASYQGIIRGEEIYVTKLNGATVKQRWLQSLNCYVYCAE